MFCPRAGPSLQTQDTKAAIMPKGRSSIANSGTYVAVLLGMNRCGSFPLLSAPHSLFSIWRNLKRSEKIPGAPTRRWGDNLANRALRTSPKFTTGVKCQFCQVFFYQIRDPEMPITKVRPGLCIITNIYSFPLLYQFQHYSSFSHSLKSARN